MRSDTISFIGSIFEKKRRGFEAFVCLLIISGHMAIRGISGIDIKLSFSFETPFSIILRKITESVAALIFNCFYVLLFYTFDMKFYFLKIIQNYFKGKEYYRDFSYRLKFKHFPDHFVSGCQRQMFHFMAILTVNSSPIRFTEKYCDRQCGRNEHKTKKIHEHC